MSAARKAEIKKLQGTWNIVALEVDGKLMAAGNSQIEVKGDRFTSRSMGTTYKGTITVDTSSVPWAIDLKFTEGPEKGNVNRGIFELEGDCWRLCLQMTGKARPAEFATRAGAGLALETLERATRGTKRNQATSKEKPLSVPADFPQDPIPEMEGEWAMTACSQDGRPLPAEFIKMGKRVAKGNEITVSMGSQVILRAKYAIDRSQQPHAMDYFLMHGPESGKRQFGIFDLSGDSLRISFAPPGQARPTDFSSKPGDGKTVAGWRRVRR